MKRTCSEAACSRPAFGRGLCSAHYQKARYHGELPDLPGPRPCKQCGREFTSRKWTADYCSQKCVNAAGYARKAPERAVAACEQCGADLSSKYRSARFCSVRCGQNWRNARTAERTLASKVGRTCKGCGGAVDPTRPATARYCSDECKSRSRRHESYGLSKDELDALLAQHHVCAICGSDDWGRKGPQVDHDHDTGEVRGILCGNCNTGLGHFKDDLQLLKAAVRYLS
jgi:hypothetical protein